MSSSFGFVAMCLHCRRVPNGLVRALPGFLSRVLQQFYGLPRVYLAFVCRAVFWYLGRSLFGYMDPYTLNPYRTLKAALKGARKGYMDP